MAEANFKATWHSYPVSHNVLAYLGLPLLSLGALWAGISLLHAHKTLLGAVLVGLAAVLAVLWTLAALMSSTIAVTEDGIAASNFGQRLKFIGWRAIVKIVKVRRWNPASRAHEDVFHVFDGTFGPLRRRMANLWGPIVFTDAINGSRELLDTINGQARRHRLPLFVVDSATNTGTARTGAAEVGVDAF